MVYNAIDIAKFLTQIVREDAVNTDGYGRVVLTDAMRDSQAKAQKSLAEGRCLTEDMFQTRFAKWL